MRALLIPAALLLIAPVVAAEPGVEHGIDDPGCSSGFHVHANVGQTVDLGFDVNTGEHCGYAYAHS